MSEIDQLKIEARELFEEVNNGLKKASNDKEWQLYKSGPKPQNSFKYRLNELRHRAACLKLINGPLINCSL